MKKKKFDEAEIRYHDSQLLSVEILGQDRVRLSLLSESDVPYQLILSGVKHFKCDDFREGNTVFDIQQVDADAIGNNEMEGLLYLRNGERTEQFAKLMSLIRDGTLKFVRVSSSYGASITAICEDLAVTK